MHEKKVLTISVIVAAYRRKTFLKEAIVSLLKQNFSNPIEIIVLKDFESEEIDILMKERGIKEIRRGNESFGESVSRGIVESTGDILFFLDDDDMFVENKIASVYKFFLDYPDLVYYHNSVFPIDKYGNSFEKNPFPKPSSTVLIHIDSGKVFPKEAFKFNPYFNSSSIAIRKSIILEKLVYLREVSANLDNFYFYCAVISGGLLIIDNAILTKYRVHDSTTQILDPSLSETKLTNYYSRSLQSLNVMIKMTQNPTYKKMVACSIVRTKINLNLILQKSKYGISAKEIFSFARCPAQKFEANPISLLLLHFLSFFFPSIVRFAYWKRKLRK